MRELRQDELEAVSAGSVAEGPDPNRQARLTPDGKILDDADPVPMTVIIDDGSPF